MTTRRHVELVTPDSQAGRAVVDALSRGLAEIMVEVWRHRAAQSADSISVAPAGVRELYPVTEAAYRLGITDRTLWVLIKGRRIRSVRLGRRRLIPAAAITDFIAALPTD